MFAFWEQLCLKLIRMAMKMTLKVSQHNVYFKEETIISKLELMKMGTKRRRMKMDPSERTMRNLMRRSQPHTEEIQQTVANNYAKQSRGPNNEAINAVAGWRSNWQD
nr:hypothetical protein CFP56_31180 [Quercus suber]